MTLGIGALGQAAVMAVIYSKNHTHFALILTMLPIVVFVFFREDEMSLKWVRLAHAVASFWYLILTIVLIISSITSLLPLGTKIFFRLSCAADFCRA